MGLFKRKPDPINDRTRALNAEIAALEAKIKHLNEKVQASSGPRLRSTVYPSGTGAPAKPAAPAASETVFEEVHKLTGPTEPASTPEHFNELGLRKFDLLAAWRRLKDQFTGRPATNPKLVNYLAAGSIQGLRPLRYEARVARNRFFLLVGVVGFLFLAVIYMLRARSR
jgi:hypothetical protein